MTLSSHVGYPPKIPCWTLHFSPFLGWLVASAALWYSKMQWLTGYPGIQHRVMEVFDGFRPSSPARTSGLQFISTSDCTRRCSAAGQGSWVAVEYVAAYETTSCFCMDSQGDELGHWASLASGLHTAMATTTASTRTASGRRRRQLTHVFASSPQEADNIRVSVTYGVRTPTSGRTRFQGESLPEFHYRNFSLCLDSGSVPRVFYLPLGTEKNTRQRFLYQVQFFWLSAKKI
jgi:hypothetical protein